MVKPREDHLAAKELPGHPLHLAAAGPESILQGVALAIHDSAPPFVMKAARSAPAM
jgi:hypothetical protein